MSLLLQRKIEASACVLTDGINCAPATEIWSDAASFRERIGRSLVLACVDNDFDGVGIYLNLTFGEAVPVFFPTPTKPSMLARFLREFEPSFVVAQSPEAITGMPYKKAFMWGRYTVYSANFSHRFTDELCLLATTSGSTGSQKVVRQSYENIATNTCQIIKSVSLNNATTAVTSLPISYTFGQSTVNCQIFCGGKLVVTPLAVTQKAMLDLLVSEQVNLLSGVPQTYQQLMMMRFFRSKYASGIEKFLQAGGKLPAPLEDKLREYFKASDKEFFVMYGQAEATTRMSLLPSNAFLHHRGTAGAALAGGEFRIVSPDDAVLNANEEGEIVYSGPNVALGYAENADELCSPDQFAGELYTGDTGYLDENGFIHITGRRKRFAKINGHSVNLAHIEDILATSLGGIVACFERDGKILVASAENISLSDFDDVVSSQTTLGSRDFVLKMVDVLPVTTTGKINYPALEQKIATIDE